MNTKKINQLWSLSLFVIGIATLVIIGADVFSVVLPDAVSIVLAIVELIALFFLVFSTIKKFKP